MVYEDSRPQQEKRLFKFEPWNDPNNVKRLNLDISEPPCRHCKWFKPRIKTTSTGELDGVVLCTKADMEHDFSCFEGKGDYI